MMTNRKPNRSLPARWLAAIPALLLPLLAPSAATAQQTLYVVDNNANVYKVASNGTKTAFGASVGAAGPLALDTAGNLYVGYASASGYGGGIYRFEPDGTQTNFTGYPLIANVTGLAFDASGHLFDAEYGVDSNNDSTVHKITQGAVVSAFTKLAGSQRNLTFDPAGNLYVVGTQLGVISKVTPSGAVTTFASGFNLPYGLAFDASGNLYVSNYGNGSGSSVIKITPGGTQSTFASGLVGPAGLAFDQYGNLFVANGGGSTITKITPAGVASTFATGFTNPTGLAFSAPTAPVLTSTPNATATVGTAYSYQIAAANAPASYSAKGLPAGLSLNTSTGKIAGTPTTGGMYTVSLFANNAYGTGSGILTLAISPGALQQTFYVADDGSSSIIKVAPSGSHGKFVTGIIGDVALIFDAYGNLFVGMGSASGYGGDLYQITPAGVQTTVTGYPTIADPNGLAFDASGNLYESEIEGNSLSPATIHKITPSGAVSTFASLEYTLGGVAFDSKGNLFVADTGESSVVKITPGGAQTTFATAVDEPTGLIIDANDNLFVANNANGFGLTVSKITPAGVVTTYATGLQAPSGLTLDAYGNLYVANNATHGGGTITEITPAGAKGTFATGFTNPNGIAFSPAPVPMIDSATSATLAEGAAFSYQVTATNYPTSFTASGLPKGLSINATTGVISGTLGASGVFTVTLTAKNAVGTGTGTLDITGHPSFFKGEQALTNGVYYLTFTATDYFGYYTYLADPDYIYHFDLGYEYVFNANDGKDGVYLYDFTSSDYFYTSPSFPFPYLYDFNLGSTLYYYPDPNDPGHYNTNGIRYFYEFKTGKIISK